MAKEFYTERDIEDMVQRGERSITIHDDVVLTDLAYEKARRLGVALIHQEENPPAAPIRPYVNDVKTKKPQARATRPAEASKLAMIRENVKAAVRRKFGGDIDESLLDRVIDRVAAELGLK